MKLRTAPYFLGQAALGLRRNGLMSVAAVLTVAIALFIFGAFLLLVLNANYIALFLESNVEIAAYLEVDAPRSEAQRLVEQVRELAGVAEVKLVTKEEGLAQLSRQFGAEHDLLAALGGTNPLPDYLRVKATSPEAVEPVAQTLARLPRVEKVDYGKNVVERLFQVLYWVRWLGVAIMLLLALAAVFLVAITIRLTVYARRREVAIMKYVGASDWFIRVPFFLEGLALGLLGSILAVGALYLGYDMLLGERGLGSLSFIPLLADYSLIGQVLGGLLLAGMLVGAVGSVVSVRHYLKA